MGFYCYLCLIEKNLLYLEDPQQLIFFHSVLVRSETECKVCWLVQEHKDEMECNDILRRKNVPSAFDLPTNTDQTYLHIRHNGRLKNIF